ncbi:MAG: M6 family metalloprotease domain-containing protein [Calditrichaeota bacterium]|nr:M6 family metalloprotease domain-containing protein [Calditrichota bacterium]
MNLCSVRPHLVALLLSTCLSQLMAVPSRLGVPEPVYSAGVNEPSPIFARRDAPDLEGEWRCLVILIDFADYPWDHREDENFPNDDLIYTDDHIREMLFSENSFRYPGSRSRYTGSMRDYYTEVSGGLFTVTGTVTRWYRAPQNYRYYCNSDGQAGTDDDYGFGSYPRNVQRLVEDALALANEDLDLSVFDNDGDGVAEGLFIVHAGPGAEELPEEVGADYIWSHKWSINERQYDGVTFSTYTIEPQTGLIGVFCHEFGHAIGLPDLYDTDDTSEGVGEWCLMGGGAWCRKYGDPEGSTPSHLCGWAKKRLGWVEVVNIDRSQEGLQIAPVIESGVVYRLWTGGAAGREYFLLENRQPVNFDAGLTRRQFDHNLRSPEGLLIMHIDETRSSNRNDARRLVDIEEASPVLHDGEPFEQLNGRRVRPADRNLYNPNRGDDGDLWPGYDTTAEDSTDWAGERVRNYFGAYSVPSSHRNTGEPTEVEVSNIQLIDGIIRCNVRVSAPDGPVLSLYRTNLTDPDGDGDGRLESGEAGLLRIVLANNGNRTAQEILAHLVTDSPLFEVVIDSIHFGDIDPGRNRAGETEFLLALSDTAPASGLADFDLLVRGTDGMRAIESRFTFAVAYGNPDQWFKFDLSPVMSARDGSWDRFGAALPCLLVEDGVLKCWYVGVGGGEAPVEWEFAVGYAESDDGGRTWQRRAMPVMRPNPNLEWISRGIMGFDILRTPEGYLMAMIGMEADGNLTIPALGTARSDDGLEWEIAAEPFIRGANEWFDELSLFGNLSLNHSESGFICDFGAVDTSGVQAIGRARSDVGGEWQVQPEPLLLPSGDEESFDESGLFSPSIKLDGDSGLLYYLGADAEGNYRLGEAAVRYEDLLTRRAGAAWGGAVLELSEEGVERDGMLLGARAFEWEGEPRLLYSYLSIVGGGEMRPVFNISLATRGVRLDAPSPGETAPEIPRTLSMISIAPNPFNSTARIVFELRRSSEVSLTFSDLLGRSILDQNIGPLPAGRNAFIWHAGRAPAGLYFVTLSAGGERHSGRLILLK